MATQYAFNPDFLTPEFEFQAEELKKKLRFSLANFAQIRFKRSVQMRMSALNNDSTKT